MKKEDTDSKTLIPLVSVILIYFEKNNFFLSLTCITVTQIKKPGPSCSKVDSATHFFPGNQSLKCLLYFHTKNLVRYWSRIKPHHIFRRLFIVILCSRAVPLRKRSSSSVARISDEFFVNPQEELNIFVLPPFTFEGVYKGNCNRMIKYVRLNWWKNPFESIGDFPFC